MSAVAGKPGLFEKIFIEGWRPYAWIALAIALLYAKSLSFGYTYLDDSKLILENLSFLRDPSNALVAFFQKVFPTSYLPYYRPVLTLSFMLDAQWLDNSLFYYHLTNIAIHVAATWLVFAFLAKLGCGREMSFLFSALFAVHPALAQGVAWVPGRNDTLLAVFTVASLLCLIDFLEKNGALAYSCHILLFALALFTKETALVFIPVCLVYVRVVAGKKILSRGTAVVAAGWAAAALAWFLVREEALQNSRSMNYYEMGSLIVAYLPAALQFLGKIFFPFNLSVFPIIRDTTTAYGAVALVIVAAALATTRRGRRSVIIFGATWAVLFLLPSLIRANTRLVADFLEHRIYVPLIGFMAVVCETGAVRSLAERKALLRVLAGSLIILFSAITFGHMDNFAGRFAFWNNAVRTSPHSSLAHLALAIQFHDDGKGAEAEAEYRKCLALDPLEPGALYGLGDIRFKLGDLGAAERYIRKTIAVYPGYDNAYLELGAIFYKTGRLKEAERMWNKTIMINPMNARAYKNLAIYYYEQEEFGKAAYCVRQLKVLGVAVPESFTALLRAKAAGGER